MKHFIPSRQYLQKNDFVNYLDLLSKDCLTLGISLGAAKAIQYQITAGYNNGKYRNMRELRNAALVRMLATMLGMVIHSVYSLLLKMPHMRNISIANQLIDINMRDRFSSDRLTEYLVQIPENYPNI